MRAVDITGKRFGRLTALEKTDMRCCGRIVWKCVCDCGEITYVDTCRLKTGTTRSCGCLYQETRKGKLKHGESGTRLHRIWKAMHTRCTNHKTTDYKYYGERGITICEEWNGENGYENFSKWARENGYEENLTIDRIDVDGNYEPSNCRWVTQAEQNRNKRKRTA